MAAGHLEWSSASGRVRAALLCRAMYSITCRAGGVVGRRTCPVASHLPMVASLGRPWSSWAYPATDSEVWKRLRRSRRRQRRSQEEPCSVTPPELQMSRCRSREQFWPTTARVSLVQSLGRRVITVGVGLVLGEMG